MAKVTETTPKVERSFTLEVNEDELQVLKALLNMTTQNSSFCMPLWKAINTVSPISAYKVTPAGSLYTVSPK